MTIYTITIPETTLEWDSDAETRRELRQRLNAVIHDALANVDEEIARTAKEGRRTRRNPAEKVERNIAIHQDRLAGKRWVDIARDHGIHATQVREIFNREERRAKAKRLRAILDQRSDTITVPRTKDEPA